MFDIAGEAKKIQDQIVLWRRGLHQIPETGLQLPETAHYVSKKLSEMGIEFKDNIGVSGIVGLIAGKKGDKTIAIRADMDALPIKEETGLPFASQNNKMHACGHDAHTAMLLGAAEILRKNKDNLEGNVKLIFQAAEEGPGGAKLMIDDGVLENPKVDAILGQHIGTIFPISQINTGEVGVCYDNLMACLDKFEIKVIGKGCHGAMPDTGVDPIVLSAQIINIIQTIISREIKATEPAIITIGEIHGGSSYNIIPDYVSLLGTARAVKQETRERIASRLEEIISNVTKSMGGTYEFNYTFGYPPLKNDLEFTKDFVESAKKIVGENKIKEIFSPTMGGEDMSYYLEKVPGTYFLLGGGNKNKGIIKPHHSSKFDIDEDVLWVGTALLAQASIDWLNRHSMY